MSWRVDKERVAQACEELGITVPVRVEKQLRLGINAAGEYIGRDQFTGQHRINLLATLPRGEADRVLWHELEHARQCEHDYCGDVRAFMDAYNAQLAAAGIDPVAHARSINLAYREIPLEQAARLVGLRGINRTLTVSSARRGTVRRTVSERGEA